MLTNPTPQDPPPSARRILDPIDRLAEVLFGLIMVLTFTGSLSVAEAGRDDVRAMLIGALGCNLAWGIIDAAFYLMGCMAERGRWLIAFRAVRSARSPEQSRVLLADTLPQPLASILDPAELDSMRARLAQLPEPPARPHITSDEWLGAAAVFLLVFLSTFPVVIPFIVMRNALPALRVSNAIAVAMLFGAGYSYGRATAHHPVRTGIVMVVFGGGLVGLTMALGG